MAKNRRLASQLTPQFTQKSGLRKGQKFDVVTGKSGLAIRRYASGDTAIASTDAGVNIAAQKRDVAKAPQTARPTTGFDSTGNAYGVRERKLRAKRTLSSALGRGK